MTPEEISRETRKVRLELLKEQLEAERRQKPWWRHINFPVFVPVMTALVAGLVAIFGNLRAEGVRLQNELTIARFEREASLIVEVSKAGREDALNNLEWLIDAGLVGDDDGLIRALIEEGRGLTGSTGSFATADDFRFCYQEYRGDTGNDSFLVACHTSSENCERARVNNRTTSSECAILSMQTAPWSPNPGGFLGSLYQYSPTQLSEPFPQAL